LVLYAHARYDYRLASLVILNTISPSKLSDDLILYGHHVWEAFDVSEVLFLCEQHQVDVVIIAADVEDGEMIEKGLRGTVFRLKPNGDGKDAEWELHAPVA
jgi:hypothetical protein